jgi:putative transposase
MTQNTPSPLGNVISIDDERIKGHLDCVVRGTVEETLSARLEAEADRLCNAQRYECNEARRDTRAGHYERKLQTKAGGVGSRCRSDGSRHLTIIERCRRRARSVEEALIEMYLAGVSVRRMEDSIRTSISTALCSSATGAGDVQFRNRPSAGSLVKAIDCKVFVAPRIDES